MHIAMMLALQVVGMPSYWPEWVPPIRGAPVDAYYTEADAALTPELAQATRRCRIWARSEAGNAIRNRADRERIVGNMMHGCLAHYYRFRDNNNSTPWGRQTPGRPNQR